MALLPSAVVDAFLGTLKAFGSSNHLLQELMKTANNRKQGLESVEVFKDTVCLHSPFSRPLSPHCQPHPQRQRLSGCCGLKE